MLSLILSTFAQLVTPQVLVSYKQGLIGKEDFLAPDRKFDQKPDKPLELCDTLQPHAGLVTSAEQNPVTTSSRVAG